MMISPAIGWLALAALGQHAAGPIVHIAPAGETQPVAHAGDAADDPAIWRHPSDPRLSLIIATDKKGGLPVYCMDGSLCMTVDAGPLNNVDVRQGVSMGDRTLDVIAASRTDDATIRLFTADPETLVVSPIGAGPIETGMDDAYGLCLYHSAETGDLYCFVNSKAGRVQQWRLEPNSAGELDGTKVREFWVGSKPEGMVADDELGVLYVGEEENAIWKYKAEPDAKPKRSIVAAVRPNGPLVGDIEGLALYRSEGGEGYLIASDQGASTFAVFGRSGDNAYLFSFRLTGFGSIDRVSGTDGIDVTNARVGDFGGLIVVQDNDNPGANQNFKLVSWRSLAEAAAAAGYGPLVVDPHYRPSDAELEE